MHSVRERGSSLLGPLPLLLPRLLRRGRRRRSAILLLPPELGGCRGHGEKRAGWARAADPPDAWGRTAVRERAAHSPRLLPRQPRPLPGLRLAHPSWRAAHPGLPPPRPTPAPGAARTGARPARGESGAAEVAQVSARVAGPGGRAQALTPTARPPAAARAGCGCAAASSCWCCCSAAGFTHLHRLHRVARLLLGGKVHKGKAAAGQGGEEGRSRASPEL